MYSDMYNREFDGGADVPDKIHVGGVPVENILPSIGKDDNDSEQDGSQDGGGNPHKKCSQGFTESVGRGKSAIFTGRKDDVGVLHENGPFANKVVPAGLVLIQIRKDPDVEYEEHVYPGVNREVVPESLYDMLVKSVLVEKRRNKTPPKNARAQTTTKRDRSRRKNRK
jgi:hypothetical protein